MTGEGLLRRFERRSQQRIEARDAARRERERIHAERNVTVEDPFGVVNLVRAVPAGEPLGDWYQTTFGVNPGDVYGLSLVANPLIWSVVQVRTRRRSGWTVGVLRQGRVLATVTAHREHVPAGSDLPSAVRAMVERTAAGEFADEKVAGP